MTSSGCLLEALGSLLSPRSTGLTWALCKTILSKSQAGGGHGGVLLSGNLFSRVISQGLISPRVIMGRGGVNTAKPRCGALSVKGFSKVSLPAPCVTRGPASLLPQLAEFSVHRGLGDASREGVWMPHPALPCLGQNYTLDLWLLQSLPINFLLST